MNNDTLLFGQGLTGFHTVKLRALSLLTALGLVVAMFVLVQHRAEAAPSSVTASVSLPSVGGGGAAAQINIGQFVCPTLLQIRAAFANSPFFAFVVAAINPLLVAFGCTPSG